MFGGNAERATVIVPTYKHQDYLRCCLLSILNSSVPVEVIIVPVLSDQPTLEEIEHLNEVLAQFDRKVEVIASQKADVFHQLQLGLDNVETEYFSVMGSDDCMLPNMMERMLSLADDSKADNPIVGLSYAFTDEHLNITSIHKVRPFSHRRMMKGSVIPDFSLVKTQNARLVGGFLNGGPNFDYLNHYAFFHRLIKLQGTQVILSPDLGCLYRQLPNSRHSARYSSPEAIKIHRAKMREIARYYWGD